MSVLIKDMNMPIECEECNLESYCGLWAHAPEGERHIDCPLSDGKTVTNNKVNLCDSCQNNYPECNGDVLFGDGVGNDNICCCNCYKPLQTKGAG